MRLILKVATPVDTPIVVGQDSKNGRRQLIPINGGTVELTDLDGNVFKGTVLPGGCDSQIIRPDGKCDLSARYAVRLEDGRSFYIENNGMRTVPAEYVEQVVRGEFIDASLYYFATTPKIEVFDDSLRWMENHVFVCKALRHPSLVEVSYFMIE